MIGFHYDFNPLFASQRYRCEIPMRELIAMGEDVKLGVGDVTIFPKHFNHNDAKVAERLKKDGRKVIFDICDDHFKSEYRDYYMRICAVADAIVVPTDMMRKRVAEETGKIAKVIPDPYEFPQAKVNFPNEGKNVLWFGHDSNLKALTSLPPIDNILIVTTPPFGHVPWSKANMLNAFAWADVVVLPVGEGETKLVKSANRMVEAIRQGKFVVANPLPSYEGFGMFLGDIHEGLEWFRKNLDEAKHRVASAQLRVEQMHNPRRIGLMWKEVIHGALDVQRPENRSCELAEAC